MEEGQFDTLKSSLDELATNTSWTWYNNNELEKLNETMTAVQEAVEENNDLLRELITVLKR